MSIFQFLLSAFIAAFILTAPSCFAYDRVIDYEDSQNIILTFKINDYEKYALSKISKAIKHLELPEDTKFTIVIRKNGRIKNIGIDSSSASKRDKSWATRALNRMRFKPIPDIESGTLTLTILKKELMNPPYKHDSETVTMRNRKAILIPKAEVTESAKREIEKLRFAKSPHLLPLGEINTNRRIIDLALTHNFPDDVKESVNTIENLYKMNRSVITARYGDLLAHSANLLCEYRYYDEAISLLRIAIQIQSGGDSFFIERPKFQSGTCATLRKRNSTKLHTIERQFHKIERVLFNDSRFDLLSNILELRVKQLEKMTNVDQGLKSLKRIDWSRALLYLASQQSEERESMVKKSNQEFSTGLKSVADFYGYDSREYKEAALERLKDLNVLKFDHKEFEAVL